MITKKTIETEIVTLESMKDMVESFEEVAAIRIRRNRDQVLRARQFADEINSLFQQVRASASKIVDPKKTSYLARNGKTLFVFLSTNTGLYGDIVRRTFALFSKYVGQYADQVLIIGKVGLKLVQNEKITKPITYLDFPENKVDASFLNKIAPYLLSYEHVIVFYARFSGIMHQEESMTDISGSPLEPAGIPKQTKIQYFFEPEAEKILAFFEKEIFVSILEQTIREFELAKLSSRVVGLNRTIDHIEDELKKSVAKRNALLHAESNRKQLQTLSSMSLWDI